MATPGMAMQGAPPQQGGGAQPTPGPSAQPTSAVVQIVANLASLSDMLQQVFPPAAPDVGKIQQSLMNIQSLMAQTQSPAQTQAPPI